MDPNASIDTIELALIATPTLTRFFTLQVKSSSEPDAPRGRPPDGDDTNDILSFDAAESKVTESAETLFAVVSTKQSASKGNSCKVDAKSRPDTEINATD